MRTDGRAGLRERTAGREGNTAWILLGLAAGEQPFHGLLYGHTPRSLEQNSVALARFTPQKISSRLRVLKKVRGARHTRTHRLIDHVAGSPPHSHHHINPPTRRLTAYFAV